MASYQAIADGNWSDPATWDDGTLFPGVGDDAIITDYDIVMDYTLTDPLLSLTCTGTGSLTMTTGTLVVATADFLVSGAFSFTGMSWGNVHPGGFTQEDSAPLVLTLVNCQFDDQVYINSASADATINCDSACSAEQVIFGGGIGTKIWNGGTLTQAIDEFGHSLTGLELHDVTVTGYVSFVQGNGATAVVIEGCTVTTGVSVTNAVTLDLSGTTTSGNCTFENISGILLTSDVVFGGTEVVFASCTITGVHTFNVNFVSNGSNNIGDGSTVFTINKDFSVHSSDTIQGGEYLLAKTISRFVWSDTGAEIRATYSAGLKDIFTGGTTLMVASEFKSGQTAISSTASTVIGVFSKECRNGLLVKSLPENTGIIYIGGSGVNATNGYPLSPGESRLIPVAKVENVRALAAVNNEKLAWHAD